MFHNHHGHNCEHYSLAYCKACNVVYCKDCGKEWGQKNYAFATGLVGGLAAMGNNAGCRHV